MDASQGEAAKRATEETVKPQTQRFRVNVPAADEAVTEWMAAQYNHSLSVRLLIREAIERHGYIDIMNRPVAQLPKRGRPAGAEEEPAAQPDPVPTPAALQLVPDVPAASTGLDFTQDPPAAPELLGIALESPVLAPAVQAPAAPPTAHVAPAPAPSTPEPPAGNQVDVNDIFTSIR